MKGHRFLLAALSASAALLLAGCGGGSGDTGSAPAAMNNPGSSANILPQAESGVPFELLSTLATTAIGEKRTVVVRDNAAWQRLWAEHVNTGTSLAPQPAPAVDFSQDMVVGVFLGAAGACDNLSIESVRKKEGPARIEVVWKHTLPPPETVCITSMVNHGVLVAVPQSALPVDFVQASDAPAPDLVIRSGWSFGMCINDCTGEAEIRQDGATLHVTDNKPEASTSRSVWGPVSAQEWDTLQASFQSLPDVMIGCPDCADEGREWIEVVYKGSRKRVDFSCNAMIGEAKQLQETVRSIRSRLAVALGLPEVCNPGSIEFEHVEPAVFSSQIADKRFVAVRDAAAWAALWSEHTGGRAPLPSIDFSRKMMAGVFLGGESHPCGGLGIASVRQRSNPERIEVGYRVTDPGPDVACIAVVINQYAFVTLPASPLPVEFVKLP